MKKSLHQKNKGKNKKGLIALSQVAILLVAIFSFAWVVGGIESASAALKGDEACVAKGGGCIFPLSATSGQDCLVDGKEGKIEVGLCKEDYANKRCCVPNPKEEEGEKDPTDYLKYLNYWSQFSNTVVPTENIPKELARPPTKFLGEEGDSIWDFGDLGESTWGTIGHIAVAAGAAVGFAYAMRALSDEIGANADWTNTLTALGAAIGGAGYLMALAGVTFFPAGLAIGAGLFILFAIFGSSTVEKGVVNYYCQPWDAPTGGENCGLCNKQEVSCSEYQCRSLGQSCEYIASDPEEEGEPFCFWNNRNDINPPVISPWEDVLTVGYTYRNPTAVSPPDRGVRIEGDSSDGCLSPFSMVTFGIEADEPAKCKIDFQRKGSFDDMANYLGGSQTRKFNHTQTLVIPNLNQTVGQDNQILAYVRCQDSNGNNNQHNFVFEMCVQEGPDTTPPLIYGTSIENGASIPFGVENASVDVYVNEPAECKWSFMDRLYDDMENDMTCSTEPQQINLRGTYTCNADLTGIRTEQTTDYFFRCRDQPSAELNDRNTNAESYRYKLVGSRALKIVEASPNDTIIKDSISQARIPLKARTIGGTSEGNALCYYSDTGIEGTYTIFDNSASNLHSTDIYLSSGDYEYYIKCTDLGGNADVEMIYFTVEIDNLDPIIARAYYEDGYLKIITNEEAECVYSVSSCEYLFEDGAPMTLSDGIEHFLEWNTEIDLKIKCQDIYGNQPASPNDCSIELRAQNDPDL